MTKPFAEVRALVGQAKEQLRQFGAVLSNIQKWEIKRELDPDTGLFRHVFRILDIDDMELKLTGRLLIGTLRSALDHLNAECARLAGARVTRNMHFPFGRTEEDVRKSIASKSQGVPQPVQDYFLSLAPYADGNLYLFELNKLRNQSEHFQLMTFLPEVGAVQVCGMSADRPPFIIDIPDGVREMELIKSPIATINYGVSIMYKMPIEGVNQTSALGFEPIIALVEQIVDQTENIMANLGFVSTGS